MKTKPTKLQQIKKEWHLIDVSDQILGRIATRIALLLRGKSKPYFVSHLDCGDYVVVINAAKVLVSGKKEKQKIYTHYSGYPGGLKSETLGNLRLRKPEEIIKRAVNGMLPKNKLQKNYLARLFIYKDAIHPHEDKFKSQSKKTEKKEGR